MFSGCFNCCIKLSNENHSERISNIKPLINEYNWEGIDFPSHQDGQEESEKPNNIMLINCKKFKQNNETIALNILYVSSNKKEICVAYESKYNRSQAQKSSNFINDY